MEKCFFCQIISGEIKCQKIYETEDSLAFLNPIPSVKGANDVLIIPKKHAESLDEISLEELTDLIKSVQEVKNLVSHNFPKVDFIKKTGEKDGHLYFRLVFNVDQNNIFVGKKEKKSLKTILVCGGAGFIGSNFIHYFLTAHPDWRVVNYDKLTYAGNLNNLRTVENNPNYKFVQGDITDLAKLNQVIQENKITHIINFAAETHVDRSIHGGCQDFVLTNSLGVQMLLDAARKNNIEKFVNVSTDEVYGSLKLGEDTYFTEETPFAPNMPYAAAKAGGDHMCHAYFKTHGVPVIVTHCSNNYGPYQFPEKLIPYFVFRLLENKKVPVYGDGLNIRDWIYVLDHVKALDLLLQKGEPGEVYNIGVDNERSNLDITKMILKIMGKGEEMIEYVKDRPGHDRRYAIDATKIKSLGWQPEYPAEKFEQGLRETVEWYLNNKEWVKDLWQKKKDEMNKWQEKFCFSLKKATN